MSSRRDTKNKTVKFRISPLLNAKLDKLAQKKFASLSEIARIACVEFVERDEKAQKGNRQ
jgi:predicted transcriptional regulator